MAQYYFTFTNGKLFSHDPYALELPSDEAARREGELTARDLWSDPGEGDWDGWIVEIADEKGRHVASIPVHP